MSYLIALYVWYHGNNLLAFGIHKGKGMVKEENKGLKTYEDYVDSGVLPLNDLEVIRRREAVMKENNYEDMMRNAIIKAQQQSMNLHRHGLVSNDIIENTPDGLMDEVFDNDGEISMGFFDELNGF